MTLPYYKNYTTHDILTFIHRPRGDSVRYKIERDNIEYVYYATEVDKPKANIDIDVTKDTPCDLYRIRRDLHDYSDLDEPPMTITLSKVKMGTFMSIIPTLIATNFLEEMNEIDKNHVLSLGGKPKYHEIGTEFPWERAINLLGNSSSKNNATKKGWCNYYIHGITETSKWLDEHGCLDTHEVLQNNVAYNITHLLTALEDMKINKFDDYCYWLYSQPIYEAFKVINSAIKEVNDNKLDSTS